MIIFEYKVSPAYITPNTNKTASYIRVTDDAQNNAESFFFGKRYTYTLPIKELNKIKEIISRYPDLFEITNLEPNDILDGTEFSFTFSDGDKSNSFSGYNILDYGSKPRKNATLALRVAREIKELVLQPNGIRTIIPSRLQNWPKYRKSNSEIKI